MILARYLLVRLAGPFLFGLALFSGVLLLDKVFDVADLLVNKGVSTALSLKIFTLFLPTVLSLSVPMSILLACLLTFGRLSEDSEVTALRASGLSFGQILWPPLAAAALFCCVLVPFNAAWAPRSMSAFRSLYFEIANQDPLVKIEPGQFTRMKNVRLYARSVERGRNLLHHVWLTQRFDQAFQRVYARTGTASADDRAFTLDLQDGQLERVSRAEPRDLLHVRFKRYTLHVPFENGTDGRSMSWRERSIGALKREILKRRREGVPDGEPAAEYHLRFAISFSPLALALLGIPLGMTLERGGRGVGFGASLGVIFGYYLLLVMGLSLAQRNAFPALPALWIANLFTLAVGGVLYYRRMAR